MSEADIKLRVVSDDQGCELRLADVCTLLDLAEELVIIACPWARPRGLVVTHVVLIL